MKDELITKFITDIEGRDPEHIAKIAERMLDQYGKKEWARGYNRGYHSKTTKTGKQKALRLIMKFIDPKAPGSDTNRLVGDIYTQCKEQL